MVCYEYIRRMKCIEVLTEPGLTAADAKGSFAWVCMYRGDICFMVEVLKRFGLG